MSKQDRDPERDERITMEIVVDCYGPEEQAMGWYHYLQDQLQFPFAAKCVAKRSISPLEPDDEVEVSGMADAEECESEMFVKIDWGKRKLAVPLSQLEPVDDNDEETMEAVLDWHYWVGQGRMF
ncbi:MAG: calcium-binding protein [Gemmataceae bacterium]